MTFVPLLGYYIQRPPAKKESTIEEKASEAFMASITVWWAGQFSIAGPFCGVLRVLNDRRLRSFTP